MFWVNLMKILYRRQMYRNQKTSGQCRQVGERVHLCQTNLQMAFATFHEHAWYWSPENVNWNNRKSNRKYYILMELGKELTKPNIIHRAFNLVDFKLHVRRAIETMGFSVTNNPECSSSSTRRSNEKRKRGRCFLCFRKDDRNVTTFCFKFKRFICKQHRVTITTVACVRDFQGHRDWTLWWWAWWLWIQNLFCKKFVLSTLTWHQSNAQTKIKWVKNFHYVTLVQKPLFYFQLQKLDILIEHTVQ